MVSSPRVRLLDRGVGDLPVEVGQRRLHLLDAHLGVRVRELPVVVHEHSVAIDSSPLLLGVVSPVRRRAGKAAADQAAAPSRVPFAVQRHGAHQSGLPVPVPAPTPTRTARRWRAGFGLSVPAPRLRPVPRPGTRPRRTATAALRRAHRRGGRCRCLRCHCHCRCRRRLPLAWRPSPRTSLRRLDSTPNAVVALPLEVDGRSRRPPRWPPARPRRPSNPASTSSSSALALGVSGHREHRLHAIRQRRRSRSPLDDPPGQRQHQVVPVVPEGRQPVLGQARPSTARERLQLLAPPASGRRPGACSGRP